MTDLARTRDRVVQLKVTVVIPCQRSYSIAFIKAYTL